MSYWVERTPIRWGVIGVLLLALLFVLSLSGCGGEDKARERPAPTYNTPVEPEPITPQAEIQQSLDTGTYKTEPQAFVETSAQGGAGLGTFSVGYRVGMITKFSVKGLMSKTGEGQMLMGRESTPYVVTYSCGDGDTCRKTINPWYFSMQQQDAHLMQPYAGEYVWTQYNQAQVKSPLYDTDYLITQIGKIDRVTPVRACVDKTASGAKSEGVRVGRIVKASMKGHMSKTGEIMIQVGNAGNQFKNMSVTKEMYDCAVTALKSAKKVKVHYAQSWFRNPFASDTTYAVTKIEPIQDI